MTSTTSVPSISKASDRKMFRMKGRSSSMVSTSEENLQAMTPICEKSQCRIAKKCTSCGF